MTLYVVERWLARLSASPYAEDFVLKGGMLLAAYDARRPTADVALARGVVNDQDTVVARITDVADQAADDGVEFLTDTAVAGPIREEAFYRGVRVAMDSRIATAIVRDRLDVNFGDPVTPAPRMIELPSYDPMRHGCGCWAIRSGPGWRRSSRPRSRSARPTRAFVTPISTP